MPFKIVGRERLKTFPPRLEGRCPFQPYKTNMAFQSLNALAAPLPGPSAEAEK
jgi:hypothetical protein